MGFFLDDTKEQIHINELLQLYMPQSKLAQALWKQMKPFLKEDESRLFIELEQISAILSVLKNNSDSKNDFNALFASFYDISPILIKLSSGKLNEMEPLVELYELKNFLWFSYQVSNLIEDHFHDKDPHLLHKTDWYHIASYPWETWLKLFQLNTTEVYPDFSLQDLDDDKLKELRITKRKKLREERQAEKKFIRTLEKEFDITINFERYLILEQNHPKLKTISHTSIFQFVRYQGEDIVFRIGFSPPEIKIKEEIEHISKTIKQEVIRRIHELLMNIATFIPKWFKAIDAWAGFEVRFKKAEMAIDINGCKPIVLKENDEHFLELTNGYHPYLHKVWNNRDKNMKNLSTLVNKGVNIFFGANMSGKTIALKTMALIQALAQFGFYVPAERFGFSFVDSISLITGDYQDEENGLSSFGAEISRLAHQLKLKDKILYLFDEIGKATNPIEGEAIAIATIHYLQQKKSSSTILVSHYPNVMKVKDVHLYEVRNYMINRVEQGQMVYEALDIAEKLGLPKVIVREAKQYLFETRGKKDGKN